MANVATFTKEEARDLGVSMVELGSDHVRQLDSSPNKWLHRKSQSSGCRRCSYQGGHSTACHAGKPSKFRAYIELQVRHLRSSVSTRGATAVVLWFTAFRYNVIVDIAKRMRRPQAVEFGYGKVGKHAMNRNWGARFVGCLLGLGAGMSVFQTARAVTEADVAADTPIPLVAVLWHNINFGGTKRELIADTPNLQDQRFNDAVSSVGIHPGPDYGSWKAAHNGREPTVTLYTNAGGSLGANGGGTSVVLQAGTYPDLRSLEMNDKVSSVYFTDSQSSAVRPSGTAAPFNSIPIVVELFVKNNRMWLVESTRSLSNDYGSMWNDSVYSATIIHRNLNINASAFQIEFCANDFFDACEIEPAKNANGIDQYYLPHDSFSGAVKAYLSSILIEPVTH